MIHRSIVRTAAALALGIAVSPGLADSTKASISAADCERIRSSRPAQFITFERTGLGKTVYDGESRERVWLRLHNNTSCAIRFLGGHMHRRADGTFSMDPTDGEETTIEYDIYDALGRGEPRQWGGGNANTIATLGPGYSVVFSVPVSHFRQGRGVAVPFAYPWEGHSIRRFDLRHYVYLPPEELPKSLRGRISRFPEP
jgi:hypothetical protein